MKIRIGTRDSKLAMIQTNLVVQAIKKYDPTIDVEIISMKTTGDKILNVTLDKVGSKGLFVKELDEALLNDEVDITVHSYKDMPMQINEQLPIVALSQREDPRDVLISREDSENKIIGSASKRRAHQLQKLGYETIIPIRGNLTTRLNKLDDKKYDAIVLAAAGVIRSGLLDRVEKFFSVEEILPAACQGIIAVQAKVGTNTSYLKDFNSNESFIVSQAERGFVTRLNGGCSSPIAAYATVEAQTVTLTGMYVSDTDISITRTMKGSIDSAYELGVSLAEDILKG